ncbi:MAG: hypothetical protein K6B41_00490, partial [Butyrivibrio sp.]|nr:hypothetical protein [Butyrivibrio sp.]
MKDIHTLEEYEIRILEILGSEDITTHFDEMLAIGARIINGMISGSDKKLLASRIKTQIYFASDDGL